MKDTGETLEKITKFSPFFIVILPIGFLRAILFCYDNTSGDK